VAAVEDLTAEHADAATLAEMAGRALLALRADPAGAAGGGAGGVRAVRDVGAAGDRLAHQLLVKELNRLYPDDDVRSEEGLEHVSGHGRLWIIDPLDGTREFRQLDRSDWAVHVAMAIGGVAVVGAVALPALGLTLSTGAPPALQTPDPAAPPRLVVSRSRPPEVAYDVADAIGGVMIPMGSAGAKIAAVILGAAEVYVHAGGQYEWDSCAPVAVAEACGLHASRLNGDPLRYGAPDAWLPDLVVCRPELAEAVLAVTKADFRPYY
jgi:3'(2'), 5'-bisphosphate nucleotidase